MKVFLQLITKGLQERHSLLVTALYQSSMKTVNKNCVELDQNQISKNFLSLLFGKFICERAFIYTAPDMPTAADWRIMGATPKDYDPIWLSHPFHNPARGPSP